MKNNKISSFILISGVIILGVFVSIIIYNVLPRNNESNSYYLKVENELGAQIETLEINNNKLFLITSGNSIKYCVKTTKSTPKANSLCWKQIENNYAEVPIYPTKKYYVWIMDKDNNVSSRVSVSNKK